MTIEDSTEENAVEAHIQSPEVLPSIPETPEALSEDIKDEVQNETASFIQESAAVSRIEDSIGVSDLDEVKKIKEELKVDETLSEIDEQAEILEADTDKAISSVNHSTEENESTEKIETLEISEEKIKKINPKILDIGSAQQYNDFIDSRFPKNIFRDYENEYLQDHIDSFIESEDSSETHLNKLKTFLENYHTNISIDEFERIKPYKQGDYLTINELLRDGQEITIENILKLKNLDFTPENISNQEDIVEAVSLLQKSMESSYWATSGSVYNNPKTYRVDFTNHHAGAEIGEIVQDKAFVSTSVTKKFSLPSLKSEDDRTILIINFPENSIINSVFLDGEEDELVLPQNTSYVVKNKKVLEVNGASKTILEVEILPSENVYILGSENDLVNFQSYINQTDAIKN